MAEAELKKKSSDPATARLRWTILKEAVRAGATPSTPDGFHKLFEEALAAAWPSRPSLPALLGRFKFREAKDPAEGLTRAEKAEKWLPFEVGRVFSMAGRGAGKVVETNFALDSVRMDFEAAKGIAIPIGVASKGLVPLHEGHFLFEKLTAPDDLRERVVADPGLALKHLVESFGRALTMAEVKEAVKGLIAEDAWSSWWAAARKNPQAVVHGSGKTATVEWSHSADAADASLLARFGKASLRDQIDLFRKNQKRSAELAIAMAKALAKEAEMLEDRDPALAFEIAVLVEKIPGVSLAGAVEKHVLAQPLALLPRLADRVMRERALEIVVKERPAEAPSILADWFFKEEDVRTLEAIDRRLAEIEPGTRERTLEKLVKSPRAGPRAFVWFAQRSAQDDSFRARLNPAVLARLLEALSRHHELEPHRRDGLLAAAEMRFPDLRRTEDDTFFVTAPAIEAKRKELENILKVEIPENTKGITIAAAEGDLTENFEYKARREKQQLLSARAGKIQGELGKARALDPATVDTTEVRPGTRVTLKGVAGTRAVTLLGPWDSNPEGAVYSYLSDLGRALLGKTVGERATVLREDLVIEKIQVWTA